MDKKVIVELFISLHGKVDSGDLVPYFKAE
jgi:hypothetical protein